MICRSRKGPAQALRLKPQQSSNLGCSRRLPVSTDTIGVAIRLWQAAIVPPLHQKVGNEIEAGSLVIKTARSPVGRVLRAIVRRTRQDV